MDSLELFAYLERVAKMQPEIVDEDKKKVFYVVEDIYDTDEMDQALRSFAALPAVLTEDYSGMLSDNESANYTDTIVLSFMVVDRKVGKESVRDVRNRCKGIATRMILQIRKDRNSMNITPGKFVSYDISNVVYQPIGPMLTDFYGYQFTLEFIAPFSF